MNDRWKRKLRQRLDHRMDMIRHNAPRDQSVARSIEVHQGTFRKIADLWLSQPTGTKARVKNCVKAMLELMRSDWRSQVRWHAVV
jgi:hypothetical protein